MKELRKKIEERIKSIKTEIDFIQLDSVKEKAVSYIGAFNWVLSEIEKIEQKKENEEKVKSHVFEGKANEEIKIRYTKHETT
jgi:hypothetical protein